MVALGGEAPAKPKRKMPISPGRPKGYEWYSFPVPVRLRIRSLYLVQGLEPSQIAPKIDKEFTKDFPDLKMPDPGQISSLCIREGWSKQKKRIKEQIIEDAVARTKAEVESVVESTAMLAEEGSVRGIQRALDCVKSKSMTAAKDFASWAAGSRQLVAIARQARGLDDSVKGEGGNTTNLIFVGQLSKPASAEGKPCIDVSATEAKADSK